MNLLGLYKYNPESGTWSWKVKADGQVMEEGTCSGYPTMIDKMKNMNHSIKWKQVEKL